jgi:hypothetical protein
MAELAERVFTSKNGSATGNGHQPSKTNLRAYHGTEADAVRRAIETMTGELTVNLVAEAVRASGRDIKNFAVSRVLKQMSKRGEIDVAQRRFGNQGSIYVRGMSSCEVK